MKQYREYEEEFKAATIVYDPNDIVFPLKTKGMMIVDSLGRRVKLAGVNWYGFSLERQVNDGLDLRPIKDIAWDIKNKFGLNVVRLPYSDQMVVDRNPVSDDSVRSNPELKGKTPLEVMD